LGACRDQRRASASPRWRRASTSWAGGGGIDFAGPAAAIDFTGPAAGVDFAEPVVGMDFAGPVVGINFARSLASPAE
jgi:hypothetical protein